MTSYDEIKRILEGFITAAKNNPKKDAEVLALRGRWGVGKTHLYKDVVKIYPKAKYISLFGVNSSEEMKLKLCFGDIESSLQKSAGKDIIKFFRGAGDAVATALALREVKETLICIDDIERKGEKLTIKDIMGFVDMLKQRNCNVVLILNDEKLQAKDERELRELYEKTIDISPYLTPTSAEAIEKICQDNPHKLVIIDSCNGNPPIFRGGLE